VIPKGIMIRGLAMRRCFLLPPFALIVLAAPAWSQTAPRIETAALELKSPERYAVPAALEPGRFVKLMAPEDGILRLVAAPIGTMVKQTQEVVRLDTAEADARYKIADAQVKLKEAAAKTAKDAATASAEIALAKAEAELARLRVDRCTMRAPFDGLVLATPIDAGQFVPKGQALVDFGDVSRLRALVPVDRTAVQLGGNLAIMVEGKQATAKVRTIVPLPESFAALRELAAPYAAAWVELDNAKGDWQAGARVRAPGMPTGPITTVPAVAVHETPGRAGALLQVIRADYVTDLPVQVLGEISPERTQVSGAFRQGDTLIVSSSVPLAARTYIRFNGEGGSGEGGTHESSSTIAQVTPAPAPGPGVTVAPGNPNVAPIGSPGSASPTTKGAARPNTSTPTKSGTPTKPATKGNIDPF
jgi:multidrug efflux pump subunit AcrA (membrane-fusion protein)